MTLVVADQTLAFVIVGVVVAAVCLLIVLNAYKAVR